MITVTLLLGKDTVSIYKKTGIIPPEENTADSDGYVITRQFGTEAEYRAYAMAMEDLEGHRDWQMLAPVTSPAPSFRTGDFVRLTDEVVGSIRRSFGDGPADYRKEMLFEVICLRPSSENPTVRGAGYTRGRRPGVQRRFPPSPDRRRPVGNFLNSISSLIIEMNGTLYL